MTTETTTAPASLPATGFVRQKQILALFPFSRTTLWRMVRNGKFPQPEKLSPGITWWKVELVREWISDRPSAEQPQAE